MPRGEQLCVRRATQEILRSDAASGCTVLSTAVHCMLHSNETALSCCRTLKVAARRGFIFFGLAACKTLASIPREASASKPDWLIIIKALSPAPQEDSHRTVYLMKFTPAAAPNASASQQSRTVASWSDRKRLASSGRSRRSRSTSRPVATSRRRVRLLPWSPGICLLASVL